MSKTPTVIALVALGISVAAYYRSGSAPAIAAPAAAGDPWKAERRYPPLVFTSQAWLDCSISATKPGRQVLTTTSGNGFTFYTRMLPIKGGRVKLQGKGMHYKFDSYPAGNIKARFSGLGDGTITEMKAEVEVDVRKFTQPKGAGTTIHFTAADLVPDAAYVEFTGLFVRTRDKKRFPFRVVFGSVAAGGGDVTPAGKGRDVPMAAKTVVLGSPARSAPVTTSLYEAEDDVRALK